MRHALFIYTVDTSGIRRIFAAETGRSVGDKSILGKLRFLPHAGGSSIEIGPGTAVGFTEESYPFPADTTPYGGLEPLPLPWTKTPPKRYAFHGSRYTAR
jgi:hypothetical protein